MYLESGADPSIRIREIAQGNCSRTSSSPCPGRSRSPTQAPAVSLTNRAHCSLVSPGCSPAGSKASTVTLNLPVRFQGAHRHLEIGDPIGPNARPKLEMSHGVVPKFGRFGSSRANKSECWKNPGGSGRRRIKAGFNWGHDEQFVKCVALIKYPTDESFASKGPRPLSHERLDDCVNGTRAAR